MNKKSDKMSDFSTRTWENMRAHWFLSGINAVSVFSGLEFFLRKSLMF